MFINISFLLIVIFLLSQKNRNKSTSNNKLSLKLNAKFLTAIFKILESQNIAGKIPIFYCSSIKFNYFILKIYFI